MPVALRLRGALDCGRRCERGPLQVDRGPARPVLRTTFATRRRAPPWRIVRAGRSALALSAAGGSRSADQP